MIPLRVMPRMGANFVVAHRIRIRVRETAPRRTARRARRTTVFGNTSVTIPTPDRFMNARGLRVAMFTPIKVLASTATRLTVIGMDAKKTTTTNIFESRRRAMPSSPTPISISSRRTMRVTVPGHTFSRATMVPRRRLRRRRLSPRRRLPNRAPPTITCTPGTASRAPPGGPGPRVMIPRAPIRRARAPRTSTSSRAPAWRAPTGGPGPRVTTP